MNFKECYGKYLAGTATPEEELFVETELAKSEKLIELLDRQEEVDAETGLETEPQTEDGTEDVCQNKKQTVGDFIKRGRNFVGDKLMNAGMKIRTSNADEVRKVKRSFFKKTLLRSVLISLIVIAVVAGSVAAVVFGVAISAANKNRLNDAEVRGIALAYAEERNLFPAEEIVYVKETEYELELELNLNKSYFECEVVLESESGKNVTLMVNAKTGTVEVYSLRQSTDTDDDTARPLHTSKSRASFRGGAGFTSRKRSMT
ncbi:MAG: hypothetical protein LBT55_04450 [Clostridiaceae bacterium]|jgi:hypothetical protein|nr:hypothetical protein [Clostridiaceae bacterium]